MSFSAKVKNEIARVIDDKECCQKAELFALLLADTSKVLQTEGQKHLTVSTENASAARKLFSLLKKISPLHVEVGVRRKIRLRKNNAYMVKIPPQAGLGQLLEELIDTKRGSNKTGVKKVLNRKCCRRAFLRGAFLASGSLTNPDKGYHLEIMAATKATSEILINTMKKFDLQPRCITRKKKPVVYIKEGEQIVRFLNIIGAHSALLGFENVRVYREVRNSINRLVNCETANLGKTVNAALRQVEKIKLLEQYIGLEKLQPGLKEVARMRLEYPEMSLKELGENTTPPLGKSGVNHRLRRLEKLADNLRRK